MLDDVTKKRINSLRQILVGKLPDPKAQVEQITNGLIYKFMNDMDEQSVSMGGKSTYFSGKFQKYSWKNLLDTKTSGVEKIKLYSEAIEQMYTNENLPELFREIFKNSFLPFKDPSTLNMFLKEINEFHYSNSEKLGDAFEYLLSFMGSQGDAGQFRTPRHIIDFITEIVNPQKNETVLDPACGTAGFLISAYKHILNQNTKKNLGDGLTASDRKKIGENLNGYDISPDMVKMSLVNMYLHKFTNPKINEYDTLSSEDRWNEYYDVILANPPFFSPKGGIMPHNRFGVNSTKAEVLFVDYINEHLKPNGRAGIIVPEGLVFQKGIAYRQLRKKLIENSLIAVISLPAGIFQPYSGVKTSILILDKSNNKKSDKINFIDIKNDGFSLNSNRRNILGSELEEYSKDFTNLIRKKSDKIKTISKKEILKNEDFSLTLSSYIDLSYTSLSFSTIKLKEICTITTGKKDVNEGNPKGIYPFFTCAGKNTYSDKFSFDCESLLIVGNGVWTGKVTYFKGKFEAYQRTYVLKDFKNLNCRFIYHLIKNKLPEYLDKLKVGNAIPFIKLPMLQNFTLPVLPIETQNQIVDELDGYQKIIDGCRQVIENYKPSIDIDPSWEAVELDEIAEVISGQSPPSSSYNVNKNGLPFYQGKTDYGDIYLKDTDNYTSEITKISKKNDIIMSVRAPVGPVNLNPFEEICIGRGLCAIRPKNMEDLEFIFNYLQVNGVVKGQMGSTYESINRDKILKIKIFNPNRKNKDKIINQILEERKIIEGNKKIIVKFSEKISNTINKIWSN